MTLSPYDEAQLEQQAKWEGVSVEVLLERKLIERAEVSEQFVYWMEDSFTESSAA